MGQKLQWALPLPMRCGLLTVVCGASTAAGITLCRWWRFPDARDVPADRRAGSGPTQVLRSGGAKDFASADTQDGWVQVARGTGCVAWCTTCLGPVNRWTGLVLSSALSECVRNKGFRALEGAFRMREDYCFRADGGPFPDAWRSNGEGVHAKVLSGCGRPDSHVLGGPNLSGCRHTIGPSHGC